MADEVDDAGLVNDAILDVLYRKGRGSAAICEHRCDCSCHRDKGTVHVMACCTGCEFGHTQIRESALKAHLRRCHSKMEL